MKLRISVLVPLILIAMTAYSSYAGDENIPTMTASQVIDQYINAVGGEEALLKLSSRTMKGTLTNDLRSRTEPVFEEYAVEAYSKLPNLRLLIEKKGDGYERQGYDGDKFWEELPNHPIMVEDKETNLKMAWLQNPQNALKIEEYFPDLAYEGMTELRGKLCHKLVPDGLNPLYYSLYFEVDTGLLKSMGFYWELQDWQEVDGVLLPFKIVADRKGGSTTYQFSSVVHNQELNDAMFAVPK